LDAGKHEPVLEQLSAIQTSYDTLVLRTSITDPIVRVSGVAFAADGRIAIGDVSQGDVKIFDSEGKQVARIGQKGSGPGEFLEPRFPRFGVHGQLYVADGQNSRITVFDRDGALLNTVPLDGALQPISGFEILSDSAYVVTSAGGSEKVLHILDDSGTLIASYLQRALMRPQDEPAHPLWKTASQYWLAIRRDTAFVVHTLNDSLWTVDLRTGSIHADQIVVPGYRQPFIPEDLPHGIKGVMDWTRSFHIAAKISVTDDYVVIPFVRGILKYGDPSVVVFGGESRWVAISDPPPLIGIDGEYVVVLLDPDSEALDSVVLGRYGVGL